MASGRKDRANSKLRNSKTKLETEVDELEKRLERFNSQKSQVLIMIFFTFFSAQSVILFWQMLADPNSGMCMCM